VAAGSPSKATTTAGVTDGERGSGTRYHRRVAPSNRAGIATAVRGLSAVVDAVGVGVGVVAEGVQEPATSARVNTCARYLKVR
jgi:hypothetical protein